MSAGNMRRLEPGERDSWPRPDFRLFRKLSGELILQQQFTVMQGREGDAMPGMWTEWRDLQTVEEQPNA